MIKSRPTLKTYSDGTRRWIRNGMQPENIADAAEQADGTRTYYPNVELHRTDGPAVEHANGSREWWVNGQRHRTDGPVFEGVDGYNAWYLNGKPHRADGPAAEHANGSREWWVNGQEISTPYTYVLNAAFSRGLPITPEVLPDMLEAMLEADGSPDDELNRLNVILNKYWPPHVKKILATLFNNPDSTVKNLAFLLLGREAMPEEAQACVRL